MKRLRWIILVLAVSACVDPLSFDTLPPQDIVVVDGMITDAPGPYIVKILRGIQVGADTNSVVRVSGAKINLHSDLGESEAFTEVEPGMYQTGGIILGRIGNSYYIDLEMPDGATFVSEPEKIFPAGQVTEIYSRYEARVKRTTYGDLPADVFNIFVDADNEATNENSFVRWRFKGTYKTGTNPELHETFGSGEPYWYKTPYPCSGYVNTPGAGGGGIKKETECTCCICYVSDYESKPRLSDNELMGGGKFSNIKVGEVPINRATFYDKYRIEIEQMTITKNAFDFFKVIRTQKDGASNLFQPPPGQLRGNIKPVDADYEIIGLFWGASITSKAIYLSEEDVPYQLPPDPIPFPCKDVYANSTYTKPIYWIE